MKSFIRVHFKDSLGNTASRTYETVGFAGTVTVADLQTHADLLVTNLQNTVAAEITGVEMGVYMTEAAGAPLKAIVATEESSLNQYIQFDIYNNTAINGKKRVSIPGPLTSVLQKNPVTNRYSLLPTSDPASPGGLIQAFMFTAGYEWIDNSDTPQAINTVDTGLLKTRNSRAGGGVSRDA
jgi:hypothetical protein